MNLDDALTETKRLFEQGVAAPLAIEPVYDGAQGPESDPWARVSATIASRVQLYCGVKWYKVSGIATIQLYFPPNHGEENIAEAVNATMQAYTSHKTNGVRWFEPAQPIKNPNDAYIQWNVNCAFQYEEHQ